MEPGFKQTPDLCSVRYKQCKPHFNYYSARHAGVMKHGRAEYTIFGAKFDVLT